MQSRYVEEDARRFVASTLLAHSPGQGPLRFAAPFAAQEAEGHANGRALQVLALRTYTAKLLGSEPSLVLHGGGNTSAKAKVALRTGETIDVLFVKGSGSDLATITLEGHPAVRLEALGRLRGLATLDDESMVNALRLALLDAGAATPSVETLLHAYLPATFIDHTHADAVLALADQPHAEKICREVYGDDLLFIPYVMPGFALALRCAEAYESAVAKGKTPKVMVLEKHGIFTWGSTAEESYERMIDAVAEAERYIADCRRTASFAPPRAVVGIDTVLLPKLRGLLAELENLPMERGPFVSCRASDTILGFLEKPDVEELVASGCATPDHVIRTKPTALFVANPEFGDIDALCRRLRDEMLRYSRSYDTYFEEMCRTKKVQREKLDPWPRVILLPGLGICAFGKTLKDADTAADIYEHTIDVMLDAAEVGSYAPVSREDLFDLEYWSLEQAKIKRSAPEALAGSIALVTGAASGIGKATALRFLRAGAHVMLVDRDAKAMAATQRLLTPFGKRAEVAIADLLDGSKVEAAMATTIRCFGGLDIVVSNAGNAPEGNLATDAGDAALRASLELNLLSHNAIARAAATIMGAQGRGGSLLFNVSKSAFNPGPGFGPYAVAKSGLMALMRQYAIDGAPLGIRSNAVNADRIRTGLFSEEVIRSRSQARGLTPEAYFQANLLQREVTADDVAEAFLHLATAKATTGCVLTVDGGNAAAFPR